MYPHIEQYLILLYFSFELFFHNTSSYMLLDHLVEDIEYLLHVKFCHNMSSVCREVENVSAIQAGDLCWVLSSDIGAP